MFNFLKKLFGPGLFSPITKHNLTSAEEESIKIAWARVENYLSISSPSSLRQAVVEADKIFDKALKSLVTGETMGERLKNTKNLFRDYQDYQDVWEAHKIRNAIVHEDSYEAPYFVTKEAISKFKKGLSDIGISV